MTTQNSVRTENTSTDNLRDLELLRRLKPYLARALTMNHDLNNSFCAIQGYAEFILSEENLDPDIRSGVEQIQLAGERISELVHSLCIEKIESREKIDLSSLLDHH